MCNHCLLGELILYLDLIKPEVVCISGHWCVAEDILNLVIPGYKLVTHFSRSGHVHGAAAIYVHQQLRSKAFDKAICLSSEMDVEFCAVQLLDYNVMVVCVYRPSTSHNFDVFFTRFERLMETLTVRSLHVCVLGDFSMDLVKDTVGLTGTFRDILDSFHLRICITEPTRGDRCIDNVFTTLPATLSNASVISPALSDHQVLLFEMSIVSLINGDRVGTSYLRRVTPGGLCKLSEYLTQEMWPVTWLDVNDQAAYLIQTFIKYLHICFPELLLYCHLVM